MNNILPGINIFGTLDLKFRHGLWRKGIIKVNKVNISNFASNNMKDRILPKEYGEGFLQHNFLYCFLMRS